MANTQVEPKAEAKVEAANLATSQATSKATRTVTVEEVPIGNLRVDPRFQVRHAVTDLAALTTSTTDIGMLEEPHCWEVKLNDFIILAGHSRIEGRKLAGVPVVACKVHRNLSEDQAKEIALDSNIARNELTPGDRCRAYADRKKLWLKRHPLHPGSSSQNGKRFEQAFASPGKADRTIARYVFIGEHADDALISDLNSSKVDLGKAEETLRAKQPADKSRRRGKPSLSSGSPRATTSPAALAAAVDAGMVTVEEAKKLAREYPPKVQEMAAAQIAANADKEIAKPSGPPPLPTKAGVALSEPAPVAATPAPKEKPPVAAELKPLILPDATTATVALKEIEYKAETLKELHLREWTPKFIKENETRLEWLEARFNEIGGHLRAERTRLTSQN
jgi:hypothetical protein